MEATTQGFDELERKLTRFSEPRTAIRLLKNATRAGAEAVRRDALRRMPKKTGNLASFLKKKSFVMTRTGGISWFIGFTKAAGSKAYSSSEAPYAHLVEFGTAPHKIRAGAGKKLKIGGYYVGKVINHPGAAPKPFLRPALLNNKDRIVAEIKAKLRKNIQREAAKR